jgi:hypothetical protein
MTQKTQNRVIVCEDGNEISVSIQFWESLGQQNLSAAMEILIFHEDNKLSVIAHVYNICDGASVFSRLPCGRDA